eukprot:TRINITY_DN28517_c0_g1_i4.p1 TRINITY_DN28517_c0_g1~~TRINITY_DN28517_c0_g1_i4.p1  ORF type:complete len:304 (+),score=4.35 TRINITY_DN28517_c0_g1_i4:85-912(+)
MLNNQDYWIQYLYQFFRMFPLVGGGFQFAFLQLFLFYYVLGFLLHFVLPKIFNVKSIQKNPRKDNQLQQESFNSLGPIAVKAAVWTVVEELHKLGITQTYTTNKNNFREWSYTIFTIIILDYLHDTWFYWSHRFLHVGWIYRNIHYIHHQSTVPSAFSGYSFHVIEAMIVFVNEIFVCFLFPINLKVHRVYHIWTTSIHMGGHCGYEMAPFSPCIEQILGYFYYGFGTNPWLNTVQHHDIHHKSPRHHFSLYFTHWDRWMGTIHPKYYQKLFKYF